MVIISKIECHPGVNVLQIKPSKSGNRAYVLCTICIWHTDALLETNVEFTLSQKQSECERSNTNRSNEAEIDLREYERFPKTNFYVSEFDPS